MTREDADELVAFQDVTVLRSTPPALLCRIGNRRVWLPRLHVSGKLWCTGDRGKLFIRRWVAHDRRLVDLHGTAVASMAPSASRSGLSVQLHMVQKGPRPASERLEALPPVRPEFLR